MDQELAELIEHDQGKAAGNRVKPVLGGDGVGSNRVVQGWGVDKEGSNGDRDHHGGKEAGIPPGRVLEDGEVAISGGHHVAEELHHDQGNKVDALATRVGVNLIRS